MTIGCQEQERPLFQWKDPEFRVKATYYFQPRAAINAFWSSFDIEQSRIDFARLHEDGFNTIILFVPWGIFQPTINPMTYNAEAFANLERILKLAEAFELKVGLRVGTHDHIPRDAGGRNWLAATVLTNEVEWAAYRDLFREVAARTKDNENMIFLFWTFEDIGYAPDPWFHQYPENVEAFRNWLRNWPLGEWNLMWGEDNESYEEIQPPDQNSKRCSRTKLHTFLRFSDRLMADRLPGPCESAKQGNPDVVVSFQPRAEINVGYNYHLQFKLPPCYSFVTTWFAPYQSHLYGNEGKELDGKRTASYVPAHLDRIKDLSGGLPVFVDQFIFQHFGGSPEEGALKGKQDHLDFIENGLPPILRDALGYSLWNYQDYYLNVINNGSFRLGLEEWETSMDNSLVRVGLPSPNPEVEIQPGGFIRQKIKGVYGGQEYTLEFQARGVETDARMRVLIRFLPTDQPVEESITLDSEMKGVSLKVQTLSDSKKLVITLGPDEGSAAIRVRDILLYPWIDTGGIYDVRGNPRVSLRDLFRRINALPLSK